INRYAAPSSLAALEWAHGPRPLVWIFYVTFRAHDNGRASSKCMGASINLGRTLE
ncbi:hypothetical protein NEUTE2DRAFT_53228, partial [Neurospora tetrasperma FGSC 2509]